MKIIPICPPNLGWLQTRLDKEALDHINKCAENRGTNHKRKLAGVIGESYEIPDIDNWFWNNVLLDLCNMYAINFENLGIDVPITEKHSFCLRSMWINYQKQYEFNPRHIHTNALYSFVIWLKIPTSYKEQKELDIAKNVRSCAISNFAFDYQNILGQSMNFTYEMEPEIEGTMVFFPSTLNHVVYPFYNCNEDRITVSGNIAVDSTKIVSNLSSNKDY